MKNKLKILSIIMLLFLLTGCTKYLKEPNSNKNVVNSSTGQNLPSNIFCQPEDQGTKDIYNKVKLEKEKILKEKLEKNEITEKTYQKEIDSLLDINKLPKCSEFSVFQGKYDGLWDTIFVKPLVWFLVFVGKLFKNYGISIIVVTLLIRLSTASFTKKTAQQSEKIKDAKPELEKIDNKYKNKTSKEDMIAKNQETMIVYRKYGINPISGIGFAILQLSLFFAFYEAMYRLPIIFEGKFLLFQMGITPSTALLQGHLIYVIFPILVIISSYYSFKFNMTASMNELQQAQMKLMKNISLAMISIASLTLSVSLSLYWITGSIFTIVQNLIVKRRK